MPTSAKISHPGVPLSTKANTNIGTTAIDAIDAFLVAFVSITHVNAAQIRRKGWSGNKLPAPVATPLPPLNFRVMGNT
jgi:hypothetical protein